MTISGNFEDFSLPELLQFLDQGKKTGQLCIEFFSEIDKNSAKKIYFWLHQGRIIAAADRLDQMGLTVMIDKRGWVGERVISRFIQTSSCFISAPMGLCLKSQGLLQPEQLRLLFHTQVLKPICLLFAIESAVFKFEPTSKFPLGEMTGLSMSAAEVILVGLRSLRDWNSLANKLPDPTSSLLSLIVKQPKILLNSEEWQVWEFVDGRTSLQEIGKALRIPTPTIQQIAFRLIQVGLAEENFMVPSNSKPTVEKQTHEMAMSIMAETMAQPIAQPTQKPAVSQSFLKNLVGFLRK